MHEVAKDIMRYSETQCLPVVRVHYAANHIYDSYETNLQSLILESHPPFCIVFIIYNSRYSKSFHNQFYSSDSLYVVGIIKRVLRMLNKIHHLLIAPLTGKFPD